MVFINHNGKWRKCSMSEEVKNCSPKTLHLLSFSSHLSFTFMKWFPHPNNMYCTVNLSFCTLCINSLFLFLQENQFHLYALYNKNKPKSDSLMSEYGSAFFRKKQLELEDKMDLASYLLKPVQRMGKYALILKQVSFKKWSRFWTDVFRWVALKNFYHYSLFTLTECVFVTTHSHYVRICLLLYTKGSNSLCCKNRDLHNIKKTYLDGA